MEKFVIGREMKKKLTSAGAPSLLDWADHMRLRHIRYKLTNHIDVQYYGTERNRQDPKSAVEGETFLTNNYFMHPTMFYNRTNLMPAIESIMHPPIYKAQDNGPLLDQVINPTEPHMKTYIDDEGNAYDDINRDRYERNVTVVENSEDWKKMYVYLDTRVEANSNMHFNRVAPRKAIIRNCNLVQGKRTQIRLSNALLGNTTMGLVMNFKTFLYKPKRTPLRFYEYTLTDTEVLDEVHQFAQIDYLNEGKGTFTTDIKGFIRTRGKPVLQSEPLVRCNEGSIYSMEEQQQMFEEELQANITALN
jgi:hypothetical protein